MSAADLRRDFIHAHTLALAALARVGNALLSQHRNDWKGRLKKLESLDWSRANAELWEGRAMNAGRLSKRSVNVMLTGNLIKRHLGLPLTGRRAGSGLEIQEEIEMSRRRNRVSAPKGRDSIAQGTNLPVGARPGSRIQNTAEALKGRNSGECPTVFAFWNLAPMGLCR